MRVLLIGTERRLFEEGSAARARIASYGEACEKLDIICFTSRDPRFSTVQLAPNVTLHPTRSRFGLFAPLDAWMIARRLQVQSIDLVSTQDPFESGIAGYLAARSLGAKLELQLHTDFLAPEFTRRSLLNRIRRGIGALLLPRADSVRVVSGRIARSLEVSGVVLKRAPVELPVYTDIARFLSLPKTVYLRERFPGFARYILTVSRLEKEKNVSGVLRAFAKLPVHAGAALVIVGEGSERSALEQEVRSLNLIGRVFFAGWQDDPAPFYQGADVFLFASEYEGFGLAPVEAAAAGLAIVSTNVGAVRETIGVGAGYFSAPGDAGRLADNLSQALSDIENGTLDARLRAVRSELEQGFGSREGYLARLRKAWEYAVSEKS